VTKILPGAGKWVQSRFREAGEMPLSKSKIQLIGRLKDRKLRAREGLVLVEGVRTVTEVVDVGKGIRFAVGAPKLRGGERSEALLERLEALSIPISWVDDEEVEVLSDTESPQGILVVAEEPEIELQELACSRRLLILDGVQDPGNLGTLIRAARAFDVEAVVALEGTVDPWNPKSVRAAAGASFHLPVLRESWDRCHQWLQELDVAILVADPAGTDVGEIRTPGGWALVIGNEGAGPRSEILEGDKTLVAVPMSGGMESLNAGVAGAILLFALTGDVSSG
jgi:TrmH family RNA methyltransferase